MPGNSPEAKRPAKNPLDRNQLVAGARRWWMRAKGNEQPTFDRG